MRRSLLHSHLSWPLLLLAAMAYGQPPRARTLMYDPARKGWVEQAPPPRATPAGDLHAIRAQIVKGKFRAALAGIKKFLKRYGRGDSLYPDLLIAKAEALIGRGEYEKAHQVLQAFLGEFSGMTLTAEAQRLEFVVADAFLAGAKRKFLGVRLFSGTDLAYRILDELAADAKSPYAELAAKRKADHLFQSGDHELAGPEYARFARERPQSRYHSFCLRRAADSALAGFGGVEYDEAALVEAEERYKEYALRYPGDADREGIDLILDRLRETRAEKDLLIAGYHERTGRMCTAVFYYEWVKDTWTGTIAATKATARLQELGVASPDSANPGEPRSATTDGYN